MRQRNDTCKVAALTATYPTGSTRYITPLLIRGGDPTSDLVIYVGRQATANVTDLPKSSQGFYIGRSRT